MRVGAAKDAVRGTDAIPEGTRGPRQAEVAGRIQGSGFRVQSTEVRAGSIYDLAVYLGRLILLNSEP
jgi:hypothetical protein